MEGDQEDSNEGSTRGEYATLDDEGRLHKKKKAVKRFRTAYILFSTVKHKEFREKLTAEKKQNGQKDNPIQVSERCFTVCLVCCNDMIPQSCL